MRYKGIALVIMLMSLLYSGLAGAAGISKGSSEVSGDFNFNYSFTQTGEFVNSSGSRFEKTETDLTFLTLRAGYGYFVTDAIELGTSVQNMFLSSKMQQAGNVEAFPVDTNYFNLDLFAKYHFVKKGWIVVPYVGAQGGWANVYSKTTDSTSKKSEEHTGNTWALGGMAGLKIFLTENTAVNTEFNYRHFNIETGKDFPTAKTDMFNWFLGLSYYFGK